MPFYDKIAMRTLDQSKYGTKQKALFAIAPISNGEELQYVYDPANEEWPYFPEDDNRCKYSKLELMALIQRNPNLRDLIHYHSYMVDDDKFSVPFKYADIDSPSVAECEKRFPQQCFLNHSCDPNLSLVNLERYFAKRDIAAGEEITCHYGSVFTEDSFQSGIRCLCDSKNCVGTLTMEFYKDPKWRAEFEHECVPYVRRKIAEYLCKAEIVSL